MTKPKFPAPQILVIYDSARGKGIVYDTAYSDAQVKEAVARCVRLHGNKANARMVLAKNHL